MIIASMDKLVVIRVRVRTCLIAGVLLAAGLAFGLSLALTFFLPKTIWDLQVETIQNRMTLENLKSENQKLIYFAKICKTSMGGK